MARLSTILAALTVFAACRPSVTTPECRPKYAWASMGGMELHTNRDFDKLDAALGRGQPVWDAYDALLKIAPRDTLINIRAAWAMYFYGPGDKGPTAARKLLHKLLQTQSASRDVKFLSLVIRVADMQKKTGNTTVTIDEIKQFAEKYPNYTGPHGLTADALLKSFLKTPNPNG